MLGDNAARQHAGPGKGIDIADGEQLAIVARPKNGDLLVIHQRAYAGIGQDLLQIADRRSLAHTSFSLIRVTAMRSSGRTGASCTRRSSARWDRAAAR